MVLVLGRPSQTPATLTWLAFVAYTAAYWADPVNTPALPQCVMFTLLNEFLVHVTANYDTKQAHVTELYMLAGDDEWLERDLQLVWAATLLGNIKQLEVERGVRGWPIADACRQFLDYNLPGKWIEVDPDE